MPSPFSCITSFEWVRDDILKYYSSIVSPLSDGALWHQLELAKLGYIREMTLVAYEEDEYPSMCPALDGPHYFYVYRCMFEVLHLTL